MSVHVFAGPTISGQETASILDAVCLPPAAQGDVYRSVLARPSAIVIIDGYFARMPAVWHKELLWALHQGIAVFGGASMGALRAVELQPFGMQGVGEVFRAYAEGRIDADDEVAVAHGEAEDGYRVVSEALVNIRATLDAAVAGGILAAGTAATLLAATRERFYPERCWPQVLADGADREVPRTELAALRDWLPSGRVDQKHRDAVALLRCVRDRLREGLSVERPDFVFEQTQNWERARVDAGGVPAPAGAEVPFDLIADELRLDGDTYLRAYKEALLRDLMLEHARRSQIVPPVEAVAERREALLAKLGVAGDAAPAGSVREHGLSLEELDRLAAEQATLRLVEADRYHRTLARLPDHLRVSGAYGPALRRARAKAALLAARGGTPPTLEELGLTEAALLGAFFARRGEPVPDDSDRYARRAGFAAPDDFRRALLLDHLSLHQGTS